jgi:hypothetical protein
MNGRSPVDKEAELIASKHQACKAVIWLTPGGLAQPLGINRSKTLDYSGNEGGSEHHFANGDVYNSKRLVQLHFLLDRNDPSAYLYPNGILSTQVEFPILPKNTTRTAQYLSSFNWHCR